MVFPNKSFRMLTVTVRLDSRGIFARGFSDLRKRIDERQYSSVLEFSRNFAAAMSENLCSPNSPEDADGQQAYGEVPAKSKNYFEKTKRVLAKRIIKAVQGLLEDAIRKESQLFKTPPESKIQKLDALLQHSLSFQRKVVLENGAADFSKTDGEVSLDACTTAFINGDGLGEPQQDTPTDALDPIITQMSPRVNSSAKGGVRNRRVNVINGDEKATNGTSIAFSSLDGVPGNNAVDSASSSSGGSRRPSTLGGVPWYMENFKPDGTTIEEEQWTGRDLVRDLSEDLSDMDEEEMSGLIDGDGDRDMANGGPIKESAAFVAPTAAKQRKAAGTKRRRARRYR